MKIRLILLAIVTWIASPVSATSIGGLYFPEYIKDRKSVFLLNGVASLTDREQENICSYGLYLEKRQAATEDILQSRLWKLVAKPHYPLPCVDLMTFCFWQGLADYCDEEDAEFDKDVTLSFSKIPNSEAVTGYLEIKDQRHRIGRKLAKKLLSRFLNDARMGEYLEGKVWGEANTK